MSKESSASGGAGIGGLLLVLFVGLKLTGYIDWSWWWVTAPIWLPIGAGLLLAGVAVSIAGVLHLIDK